MLVIKKLKKKIDRIRRANAQRHTAKSQYSTQTLNNSRKSANKSTKSMPCQYSNQGSCAHQKSHETKGTLYKHICAACFASNGRTYPHSKVDCLKLKRLKRCAIKCAALNV